MGSSEKPDGSISIVLTSSDSLVENRSSGYHVSYPPAAKSGNTAHLEHVDVIVTDKLRSYGAALREIGFFLRLFHLENEKRYVGLSRSNRLRLERGSAAHGAHSERRSRHALDIDQQTLRPAHHGGGAIRWGVFGEARIDEPPGQRRESRLGLHPR